MNINGKTRVIAHLSYPSAHLRTPSFMNPMMQQQKRNAVLVPWQVTPENLEQVWEALRVSESIAGVVVTIPHKISVANLCDRLLPSAAFMQVVNVARREPDGSFVGAMFDGEGYIRGLSNQGHAVSGRRALLIGAGGAATGVAHALVAAGVTRLTIANRTHAKAESLASRLNDEFGRNVAFASAATGGDHDLIINATSIGMHDNDPLPLDPTTLRHGALVGEVIMEPDVTPLLDAAAARGCIIHKGVHMITGQIELLTHFLLGPT